MQNWNDDNWDIQALTTYGNVANMVVSIKSLTGTTSVSPNRHNLWWAYEMLEQWLEDEIVHAKNLLETIPNLWEVFDECEFANGEELTGKLEEFFEKLNTEQQ